MQKLTLIILLIMFPLNLARSEGFTIFVSATVGQEIITNYDIMQRLRFLSYQSGIEVTQQNIPQLFFQVREILIDEAIKNDAADQLNITVDKADIDNVIADLAFKNNLTLDEFLTNIDKVVDIDLFRDTIQHQLKWQRYLYGTLYQGLSVSEYEIDEYIQSSKHNRLYEYDIIKIDFNEDQNNAKMLANDYYQELVKGNISFTNLKQQFYSSDVDQNRVMSNYANDIDTLLLEQINALRSGEISQPFESQNSYIILSLISITDKVIKNRDDIKQKLLMNKFERKVNTVFENLKNQAFIERYDQLAS
jgi:parvulin-like peptidyl-prolyl isomerase